jgi:hypothetical protein
MPRKPPPTASAAPPGVELETPDAEAIRDRLLRAADLRSKHLLKQATSSPAKFKGAWELQILIYAVNGVLEGDHRQLMALAKIGQEGLEAAVAAQERLRRQPGAATNGAGSQ